MIVPVLIILVFFVLFGVLFFALVYAEDDARLKLVFYLIVFLSAILIIGLWENIIKPLAAFLISDIWPYLLTIFNR